MPKSTVDFGFLSILVMLLSIIYVGDAVSVAFALLWKRLSDANEHQRVDCCKITRFDI
jgi:hypothetical protein